MNWLLSLKLMPGEVVVDEPADSRRFGIKTVHTPVLTNKRALFRFNTLSTGLIQSFNYDEIEDARPANRLMIKYLRIICRDKEYYMNVDVPEEWALKILGYKEQSAGAAKAGPARTPAPATAGHQTVAPNLCPECGESLPTDANFCSRCGAKLGGETVCPSCKTELAPGSKFCTRCGEKIKE